MAVPPKVRKKGKQKIIEATYHLLDFEPGKSKEERMQELFNRWYGCKKCPLGELRECVNGSKEIVFGEGNVNASVLIVGEAPGEEEEASSIPFVGKSGQLLNQILAMTSDDKRIRDSHAEYATITKRATKNGMAAIEAFHEAWVTWREANFFITNAVACRPPDNRSPIFSEIEACWERLWNIIYIMDPIVIIGAGNSAMSALLQKQQVQISKMRGIAHDITHTGIMGPVTYPVIPIFHPSYLLRKADWNSPNGDFSKTVEDVRKALRLMDFLKNKHNGTPIPQR